MADPAHKPFTTPAQRTAVAILEAQRMLTRRPAGARRTPPTTSVPPSDASRFFGSLADRGMLEQREDGTFGLRR